MLRHCECTDVKHCVRNRKERKGFLLRSSSENPKSREICKGDPGHQTVKAQGHKIERMKAEKREGQKGLKASRAAKGPPPTHIPFGYIYIHMRPVAVYTYPLRIGPPFGP